MNNASIAQQVSLEVLRNPSKAHHHEHLNLLELEDSTLSQLHPLAKIIALHERGFTSQINRSLLADAARTISVSGTCETCEREDSDDWDLTYYKISKTGRGSITPKHLTCPVDGKAIRIDFQLAYEMRGGSLDGFHAGKRKASLSLKDLPKITQLTTAYREGQLWLEQLLSNKSKEYLSLDPTFHNLDGLASISIEAVTFSIGNCTLATMTQLDLPVADLEYGTGELTDTHIYAPIEDTTEYKQQCHWPTWLPQVASELKLQLTSYYSKKLSSEACDTALGEINLQLSSLIPSSLDSESNIAYIDIEDLINLDHCRLPRFRDISFSVATKKLLPPSFKAHNDIQLTDLKILLLKLAEINSHIARREGQN